MTTGALGPGADAAFFVGVRAPTGYLACVKTLRDNWGLLAAVVPISLVAVRIYVAARGDTAAMMAIIENSSTTQVILGTLVSMLPMVLVFWVLNLFASDRFTFDLMADEPTWRTVESLGAVFVSIGLVLFLPIYLVILIAVMLLILSVVKYFIRRRGSVRNGAGRGSIMDLLVLAVTGVGYLLAQPFWFPAEVVDVDGQPPEVGYVLSEGDPSTVLWESGRLEQVPEQKILSRQYCRYGPEALFSKLPGAVAYELTPACPES